MAVEGNGKITDSSMKATNGQAVVSRFRKRKPKRNIFRSTISIVIRLLTWYSIITVIFRCPQSADLLGESSPQICKSYFDLKSRLGPHVTPYYDVYGAPVINAAQPYYDIVDKMVITPLSIYGRKYGAPGLQQARAFGKRRWENTLQPEVSKFSAAAQRQYARTFAPYVDRFIATAEPYCDVARDSALQTYYTSILPTWNTLLPYAKRTYELANSFAVNTGIPYAKWVWSTSIISLNRTVWPKLRIIYRENVEPQLIRIGERLGRYRDGKKVQAVVNEADFASSYPSVSMVYSSTPSTITSAQGITAAHGSVTSLSSSILTSIPSPTHTSSEQEKRAKVQTIIAEDLRNLQEKVAKAADEGSDELEARITEITDRFVHSQAGEVGESHLILLEECINTETKNLKKTILSLIKESTNTDASEADLINMVRKAGVAIKDKAQAVRAWRRNYDLEMASLVSKAVTETFQIIDHIRDLGLQEVGMRWAWMDGVTHKDWSKYHAMKNRFDEWHQDIEEMATNHPGLEKAREVSEDVESKAMNMAVDAAKELSRLKEAGRWKLSAGDSTDDFSAKPISANADRGIVEQKSDVDDGIIDPPQDSVESLDSGISAPAVEALSFNPSASSCQLQEAKNIISESSEGANSAVSSIPFSIEGKAQTPKGDANNLDAAAPTLIDGKINDREKASSSIESSAPEAIIGEAIRPTLLSESSITVEMDPESTS